MRCIFLFFVLIFQTACTPVKLHSFRQGSFSDQQKPSCVYLTIQPQISHRQSSTIQAPPKSALNQMTISWLWDRRQGLGKDVGDIVISATMLGGRNQWYGTWWRETWIMASCEEDLCQSRHVVFEDAVETVEGTNYLVPNSSYGLWLFFGHDRSEGDCRAWFFLSERETNEG